MIGHTARSRQARLGCPCVLQIAGIFQNGDRLYDASLDGVDVADCNEACDLALSCGSSCPPSVGSTVAGALACASRAAILLCHASYAARNVA